MLTLFNRETCICQKLVALIFPNKLTKKEMGWTKKTLEEGMASCVYGLQQVYIGKNSYRTLTSLETMQSPSKCQQHFSQNQKTNPTIQTETNTLKSQSNPQQKVGARGITISDLKLYYRTKGRKPSWYCHKNRLREQRTRVDNPSQNPHRYSPKHVLAKNGLFDNSCYGNQICMCNLYPDHKLLSVG